MSWLLSRIPWFWWPSLWQKTNFFRLLSVAQKAGVSLRDALISILKSEKDSQMKIIIQALIDDITEGKSLWKAMQNYQNIFGIAECELINSSENMGNMPETLEEISTEMENYQKITQKIRSALSYPITLIVFTIIAVAVLLIQVIPTIVGMFPDPSKLPDITVFMINTSDFLQNYRILLLGWGIGITLLSGVLYQFFLPFKMLIDRLFIITPVLGDVTKTFYMYRFSKLLSDFYKAGVSPVSALDQMSRIFPNYYYQKKVLEIKRDLESWFGFSESIEGSDLFDGLLVQILIVGENTGNVWEVLGKMAYFYRDSLSVRIETLMGFIEPILMAGIAIIIGIVVWSIFLPMADLVNVIGDQWSSNTSATNEAVN